MFSSIAWGTPGEGVATHQLVFIDPHVGAPNTPGEGFVTYLYFLRSPVTDPQILRGLGAPHMGVAASGTIVGTFLNLLPPNPSPSLFSRLRLMKAVPLGMVSPSVSVASRREQGASKGTHRKRLFPFPSEDVCLLIVKDGIQPAPSAAFQMAVELCVWLRSHTNQKIHVFLEGLPEDALDLTLLEGNDLRLQEEVIIIPPITNVHDYHAFDGALSLTADCYFPSSLLRAASVGIRTFAPDIHVWQEAITHAHTLPLPASYLRSMPDGYVMTADIGDSGKILLDALNKPWVTRHEAVEGLATTPLGPSVFSQNLFTLMGLV